MSDAASSRPLRFALVGCGTIATTQVRAILSAPEAMTLAAVCDTVEERARKMGAEFGVPARPWAEVLTDPEVEAVTVCTPSGSHGAVAMEAMAAGKHVLVEKPMDVSVSTCRAMLATQQKHGVQLAVISQHRYDAASQRVRAALDAGEMGELIALEMRVPWYRTQEYYDADEWRGDAGGAMAAGA